KELKVALLMPVRRRDRVVGVMEVYSATRQVIAEEMLIALSDLAAHFGDWLERRAVEDALRAEEAARRHAEERAREALEYQAMHDPLTGLANRQLFADRLTQTLARSRREDGEFALLILDLDGFKTVNDTMGHEAGDQVLREVARRLTASLRESDTAARMGGDEFAVLLEGGMNEAAAL